MALAGEINSNLITIEMSDVCCAIFLTGAKLFGVISV